MSETHYTSRVSVFGIHRTTLLSFVFMIQTHRNIMLYSTLKKVLPNKPTKPPIIYFLITMEKRRKYHLSSGQSISYIDSTLTEHSDSWVWKDLLCVNKIIDWLIV